MLDSLIWKPLTLLIRAFLSDDVKFCPDCDSRRIFKDGHNRRSSVPKVQVFECKGYGRRFDERTNTIFCWKHASIVEFFIIAWVFFGSGSRDWTRKWISSIGEYSCSEWFERIENALVETGEDPSKFVDGHFQAGEMITHSPV